MPYYINPGQDMPLAYDGTDSFAGGQVSAFKSNIIPQDAFAQAINMDNTLNGELVTRRGTTIIGTPPRANAVNGIFQHDFGSGTKRMVIATRNAAQGELYRESAGTYTILTNTWTSGTMTNDVAVYFAELEGTLYYVNGIGDMWKVAAGVGGADNFAQTTNGGATNANPPTTPRYVVEHTGRLAALAGSDNPVAVYFSQFLDGTVWDRATWSLKVGRKEDQATGLVSWTNFDLVVLKQHSIWLVNADPEVSVSNFTVKKVHPTIGCVCPRTAQQVGDNILFLSRDGVYSIERTAATDTQSEITVPVSSDIQDIIQRINWTRAPITAAAFFWNNRYFLGVPLDNDTENTWITYNVITGKWLGLWGTSVSGAANSNMLQPRNFSRNDSLAQPRLRFGRVDGAVFEYQDYVQEKDETTTTYRDNGVDYPSYLLTKGYTFGEFKSVKELFNGTVEFNKSLANCTVGIKINAAAIITIGTILTGTQDVLLDATGGTPVLPFTLGESQLQLKELGLSNMPSVNEAQVSLYSDSGKLGIRSVLLSAFVGSANAPAIDLALVIPPREGEFRSEAPHFDKTKKT